MEAKGRPLSRLQARTLRNYSKAVGEAGGSKTFAVYVLINPPLPPPPRVPVSLGTTARDGANLNSRLDRGATPDGTIRHKAKSPPA